MEQEQLLKLNPETGYYEGIFTVRVEAEIFRRVLFSYVEDYHIDPLDQAAWDKAISEVARTAKWMTHVRAQVAPVQVRCETPVDPIPVNIVEEKVEERKVPKATNHLSEQEEKALWDKAMELPVTEWETLLTPLPTDMKKQDKWPWYIRRHAERKSLEKLKEQLAPVPIERMEVIAEAINGTRIK